MVLNRPQKKKNHLRLTFCHCLQDDIYNVEKNFVFGHQLSGLPNNSHQKRTVRKEWMELGYSEKGYKKARARRSG
jgi:hypothetical protein